MDGVRDAAERRDGAPHGTALLSSDLTEDQLAAAPVLRSIATLLIEELSEDEDDAFATALDFLRIVVDTGMISASVSRRRRQRFERQIAQMTGNQIFLAAVTVSELRYGALVAGWGEARRERLEESIRATTVVPVSNTLLTVILSSPCR